ncbi:MAG: urease accessory UreF family protein [Anaerolineae bacterium]
MNFSSAQLLMLLQWTDSAFPTGAFAHSAALETYTQAEIVRTPDDLARLIAVRLAAAARTDLIVVHAAMSADRAKVAELDALCSASKLARETREASEKIGRRLLASVLNLVSDPLLEWYRDEIAAGRCAGHHAVAHGLACAALRLDPRAALLAFGYALAVNQTAASLKLMRIGQTQAQAVLGASGAAIEAAVETALALTLDDYGAFTPGLDIRAVQHEHLFRRLFIS